MLTVIARGRVRLVCDNNHTLPQPSTPGGLATLPLNFDAFTELVLTLMGSVFFTDFAGVLDGGGNGTAQLNAPPAPAHVGLAMQYAYVLSSPYDFASNPVEIELVP